MGNNNKVIDANSIVLTKQFVLVYNEEKQIIVKCLDNVETYPGKETYYAEFDTIEELDSFIKENEIIDLENIEEENIN